MKSSLLFTIASVVASIPTALGLFPPRPSPPPLALEPEASPTRMKRSVHEPVLATFTQYIDHQNPGVGNFSQRYYYNTTYWKGPGSPIVLFTPGESPVDQYLGYLGEASILAKYAKEVGGAVILVEHRYWGESSPYEWQSTKNLQYLTVDQAVADFVHFARNAELPFDRSGLTNAPQAPWIFVGGSYSGALAAWIERLSPGTYWAYHASSAPVEAIYDFWQYFQPIQEGLAKNCSADLQAITRHVDDTFLHGSPEDKQALKTQFGVQELDHDDDAASAISSPIFEWQNIQFFSNYSLLFRMCDTIQGYGPNATMPATEPPTEKGIGLEKGLPNYASWYTKDFLPDYCAQYNYSDWTGAQCFNTHNASQQVWNDWSANKTTTIRTWAWMTCNEPLFYWPTGTAPPDVAPPTLFTRLADAAYYQRQCDLFFPTEEGRYTYGSRSAGGRTAETTNAHLGGWAAGGNATTRVLWSNGRLDPWRSAGVSSAFRPGGPLPDAADGGRPVLLVDGARHANDLLTANAVFPPLRTAVETEVEQIAAWVADFYGSKTG